MQLGHYCAAHLNGFHSIINRTRKGIVNVVDDELCTHKCKQRPLSGRAQVVNNFGTQ